MGAHQVHITAGALNERIPEGDLPDHIIVEGLSLTIEQADKITHVFQHDAALTIQRLRDSRLAVCSEQMPPGIWTTFEPDGSFDIPILKHVVPVRFAKGDRVRVVANAEPSWIGNTGTITRVPGDEATHGAGPSTTYAMSFDGREGNFAPFTDEMLEPIEG